MKNIAIVLLVIVMLGLWFYTETTKDVIKTAGLATKEVGKDITGKVTEKVKEKMEDKNLTKEIKDKLTS